MGTSTQGAPTPYAAVLAAVSTGAERLPSALSGPWPGRRVRHPLSSLLLRLRFHVRPEAPQRVRNHRPQWCDGKVPPT